MAPERFGKGKEKNPTLQIKKYVFKQINSNKRNCPFVRLNKKDARFFIVNRNRRRP